MVSDGIYSCIPLHIKLCSEWFIASNFCYALIVLVFIPAHQNSHAESTRWMDTSKSET